MTVIEPSAAWSVPDVLGSGNDPLSHMMRPPPASIFREYDVRGLVDSPLQYDNSRITPFTANVLGRAFGGLLHDRGIEQVVVGYDGRAYAPVLASGLIQGLLSTGRHVVAVGLATTPLVYFAQHHLDVAGGVSVTASHNPNGWGGFKFSAGASTTLLPDDVRELRERCTADATVRGTGRYVERSVTEAYLSTLASRTPAVDAGLTVCVDGGNGVAGALAADALRRAGHRVHAINADLDWTYPNHDPDPELPAARAQLAEAVQRTGADLGIGLDGDGDRLSVTDERGWSVLADRTLALLAQDALRRHPGGTIVYDVKCSRLVEDTVRAAGGDPVMWKTGHSHIKAKMAELGAIFAGERSGHFFDAVGSFGFDDAVHAALRLLAVIEASGGSLGAALASLPRYHSSPTMHAACSDATKYEVVESLVSRARRDLPSHEVVRVNGARFEFEEGWFLVRASSNIPALVIICEGITEAALSRMYGYARQLLDASSEVADTWDGDPYAREA